MGKRQKKKKVNFSEKDSRERNNVVSGNMVEVESQKPEVEIKLEMHRQEFDLDLENERRARMCAAYNGMSKQRWYERIMERAIEQEYKKIIL